MPNALNGARPGDVPVQPDDLFTALRSIWASVQPPRMMLSDVAAFVGQLPPATVALSAVAVCALGLFLLVLLARKRGSRQNNDLFGSTIKQQPTAQMFQPVAVNVQPHLAPVALKTSCSENDLRRASIVKSDRGLSGYSSRWSNIDGGSESSDEMRSVHVSWILSFKVYHDIHTDLLHVTIFRAKASPYRYNARSDSSLFVRIYLLPEELPFNTKLYLNTGSPSIDESFHYKVARSELGSKQLRLSLYDMDRSKMRICLGHAIVNLEDVTLADNDTLFCETQLEQLATAYHAPSPEVHVSLCYHPLKEKMKIQIFAARNMADVDGNFEYQLRTEIILGTKSAKTKETSRCSSVYGVFQCSYAFQVPLKLIENCCLQFSVIQTNLDSGNESVYGSFVIGPCTYAHGSGVEHWKMMLSNSRKAVEMWHKLGTVATE